MSTIRISKVLSELNIGLDTAVDFLATKSQEVDRNRNAKIDQAQYDLLTQQFATDKSSKDKAETLIQKKREEKEAIQAEREQKKPEVIRATATLTGPKVAGKIDLSPKKSAAPAAVEAPVAVPSAPAAPAAPAAVVEPVKAPEAPAPAPVVKAEEPVNAPEAQAPAAPAAEVPVVEAPKAPEAATPASPAAPSEAQPEEAAAAPESTHHETQYQKLDGPKMTGQVIDL